MILRVHFFEVYFVIPFFIYIYIYIDDKEETFDHQKQSLESLTIPKDNLL